MLRSHCDFPVQAQGLVSTIVSSVTSLFGGAARPAPPPAAAMRPPPSGLPVTLPHVGSSHAGQRAEGSAGGGPQRPQQAQQRPVGDAAPAHAHPAAVAALRSMPSFKLSASATGSVLKEQVLRSAKSTGLPAAAASGTPASIGGVLGQAARGVP